jgi:hypothetical protein
MADILKPTGSVPDQHLTIYQENGINPQNLENQQQILDNLPGTQESININWLGSSYSGVDINVIAHLYTQYDFSSTLQQEINTLSCLIGRINLFLQGNWTEVSAQTLLLTNGRQKWVEVTNSADTSRVAVQEWLDYFPLFVSNPQSALRRMGSDVVTFQSKLDQSKDTLTKLQKVSGQAEDTLTLGNLQTISVQTYRDKTPVRSLGTSYVKEYTRGGRTIAGSMIFTLFNEHALAQLIRSLANSDTYKEMDSDISTLIADQLPPIDLTIAFVNEYGSASQMGIYGVEFMSDGMTLSIEDIISEEVLQFVARDIDVMTTRGNVKLSQYQSGMFYRDTTDSSASSLLFTSKDAYTEYLAKLGIRRSQTRR